MSLQSKLFNGDPKLEACLIQDSAHVTPGALGSHVSKIQTALAILDNADIFSAEIAGMRYGPSTINAVLAYKQKRKIINFNYQTKVDNIVGKMTIASLDNEMFARERRRIPAYGCGDLVGGGGGPVATAFRTTAHPVLGFAVTATGSPVFNKKLDVLWQITTGAAKVAASRHMVYWTKANQLFQPFQMEVISSVTSPPDAPFPFEMSIDPSNKSDIVAVRKAAEKARRAPDGVLRVIVCAFEPSWSGHYGTTEGGMIEGETFSAFTLLNANAVRADQCTLAHEMVHAADLRFTKKDHDPDQTNVFSEGSARTVLTANWAEVISKGYFAKPR
jgi:hypothetical protein